MKTYECYFFFLGLNSHLVLVLVHLFHFGPTFEIVFNLVILFVITDVNSNCNVSFCDFFNFFNFFNFF